MEWLIEWQLLLLAVLCYLGFKLFKYSAVNAALSWFFAFLVSAMLYWNIDPTDPATYVINPDRFGYFVLMVGGIAIVAFLINILIPAVEKEIVNGPYHKEGPKD